MEECYNVPSKSGINIKYGTPVYPLYINNSLPTLIHQDFKVLVFMEKKQCLLV
jgi:hypothetical protein